MTCLETALQRCMSAILGSVERRALKASMMAVARWRRVAAVTAVICVGGPHRTVSASPASRRCRESTVKDAGARLAGCGHTQHKSYINCINKKKVVPLPFFSFSSKWNLGPSEVQMVECNT